jgi:hypothetical protein
MYCGYYRPGNKVSWSSGYLIQWQNCLQFNVLSMYVLATLCTYTVDLMQDCIQIILKDSRKESITINVPLILKVWDIIFFFAGKTYNGAFRGVFRGGRDLLTSKLS